MSEIKVSLSLELRGGAMLSEQECSKNPKTRKNCYDYFHMKVGGPKEKDKETIKVAVRKSKTIKQNIKLSKEAYDYMTDRKICPSPRLRKVWEQLSEKERLQWHCGQIAESLGAIGFSFEVLED